MKTFSPSPELRAESMIVRFFASIQTPYCSAIYFVLLWLAEAMPLNAAVKVKTIFSFNGTNGGSPSANLLCLSNGLIYGTTEEGGTNGDYGTVFVFDPVSASIVSDFSFSGTNGTTPKGALIQAQDGSLYGTTFGNGGFDDPSTAFKISTNLPFSNFSWFSLGFSDPGPTGALVQWTNGLLYGTSTEGMDGLGYLFKLSTNGAVTYFYGFDQNGSVINGDIDPDGSAPFDGLTYGYLGALYGITTTGGTNNCGTIFRVSSDTNLTTLFSFSKTNGSPQSSLVYASDGCLYGTTYSGGASNYGTVFQFNPTNSALVTLYSFTNGVDGAYPSSPLLEITNGVFYGTTSASGVGFEGDIENGSIFQVTRAGAFSNLFTFDGTLANSWGTNGSVPLAGLVRGTDGSYYGTTSKGGTNGSGGSTYGTIYRLSIIDTTPPVFRTPEVTGGIFFVTASAVSGESYQLQYCTNLAQNIWFNTGSPVTATNGAITISNSVSSSPMFYRYELEQ